MTADGTGLLKTWSFVEKTSYLNNNEAISNDLQYTWTCTHQHVYNEETIRSIQYAYDGSVIALSHGRSITLWNATSHELLHVLPTPPPKHIVLAFVPSSIDPLSCFLPFELPPVDRFRSLGVCLGHPHSTDSMDDDSLRSLRCHQLPPPC